MRLNELRRVRPSAGATDHAGAVPHAGARPGPALPVAIGLLLLLGALLVAAQFRDLEQHSPWLPVLMVLGGAGNAFFLALALHLARTRRWRVGRHLEAIAQLREEMRKREKAERGERAALEELETVVNSFPDHVWSGLLTEDGEVVPIYYSDAMGRISGRPASEFRESPGIWIDVVHPDDREQVTQCYRELIEGLTDGLSLEYRIERPDGEIRWVRDRVRGALKDGRRRLDGVITDITQMKRAEEERLGMEARLQDAQKLESLGVLAGGIAHDFNNLLVGLLGYAHLALLDLPPGSPARQSVQRIEKVARRAAELCRQMLAYAGKGSVVVEPVDLCEVVEEMAELLGASTSKKPSIRYDLDDDLPPIEADASQLRQVVMNLITNASEAMGKAGGTIRVVVRLVQCSREELAGVDVGEALEPGPYVVLAVSDDGCGMDEETRRRLFEPFYSTKFAGRGLGLAAVIGIVRAHRGAVRVESEPGGGTTMTLYFPALEERVAAASAQPTTGQEWRGSGALLLVDDEEDAREVGARLLERAGFEVYCAGDGRDAIELFERHGDEIVCVLLDLTMPQMDGEEVQRRLCAIREDVPVILCSGYPEQSAVENFAGLGLAGFLQKPYTPDALLALLRRVLEPADEVHGAQVH